MTDEQVHAAVDALLDGFSAPLGDDERGYRGHVHRVVALVLAQGAGRWSEEDLEQLVVAAVFHDLAIWLDDTFDYLDPSADHAGVHLAAVGRAAWIPRVRAIIQRHHQLHRIAGDELAEAFRRADLCDVSLGLVHPGIPRGTWPALRRTYPIAGFHLRLLQFTWRQARREPRRPLPMLRW